MKNGKNGPMLEKMHMGAYTEGSLANVCWTPDFKEIIADRVKPHVHSFYEIVFVVSGSGSHVINGDRVDARAGDLFLFAPGSCHDPALLQPTSLWVFIFNLQALDAHGWDGAIHTTSALSLGAPRELLRDLQSEENKHVLFHIEKTGRAEIVRIFRTIKKENAERRAGWDHAITGNLALLLINLRRRHLKLAVLPTSELHPLVAQAMDFIDLNFRRSIGLRDIAGHVRRSPAYLTSLVNLYTGRPAMAWLSDRRMVEAGSLFLTSNKSVQQISEAVGYDNMRHFSYMFKRKYGDSPIQWRRKLAGAPFFAGRPLSSNTTSDE